MLAASFYEEHLQQTSLPELKNLPGGIPNVKESFDVSNYDLGFGADGPICGDYYC
jgi:hypothetical protein